MYKKPKGLLKDIQQKRLTKKSRFLKKLEAEQAENEWPKMTIEQLKARQTMINVYHGARIVKSYCIYPQFYGRAKRPVKS